MYIWKRVGVVSEEEAITLRCHQTQPCYSNIKVYVVCETQKKHQQATAVVALDSYEWNSSSGKSYMCSMSLQSQFCITLSLYHCSGLLKLWGFTAAARSPVSYFESFLDASAASAETGIQNRGF